MAAEDYLPMDYEYELAIYQRRQSSDINGPPRYSLPGPPLVCRSCEEIVDDLGDSRACDACEAGEAEGLS